MALLQVISNMKFLISWLVLHWEDDVDITQYPGTTSMGDLEAPDEVAHLLSVKEQIFKDLSSGNSWLWDTLTSFHASFQLVYNGFHSSCKIMLLLWLLKGTMAIRLF